MSPKKTLLTIGLTALGLFGSAATSAAYPGDALVPSGPAPAPASNPTHTVLLKTNGDLLTGPVSEDERHYVVHKSGGPIPIPKGQVEKTFSSIPEVYRYKLSQVDERDPDERLKLARWCLGQNLPAEAMVELRAVVALSPGAAQAKAMLTNLEASEERARRPRLDNAVVQTGGEAAMPAVRPGDPRPAELDPNTLRRAQRDLGVPRGPVIFDLPPALATKRADQFARDVHPVLQMACARCHNEQSTGNFQLIEVKSRRGPSGDILRANLDATLRLIDPDNPARSELLSSGLVPHGNRPNARPIFRGPNDRHYQIIAAWVNSLKVNRPADGAVQTQYAPKPNTGAEGFAVDRGANQGAVTGVTTVPLANQAPAPTVDRKELPPARAVPGRGMVAEESAPSPEEFPAPYLVGGPRPNLNAAPAPPTPTPTQVGPTVPSPSTVATPAEPLPPLPPPGSLTPGSPAPATKAKKPLKLDTDLLQRAILNRNSGR